MVAVRGVTRKALKNLIFPYVFASPSPRPLLKGLFSYVLVRSSEGINVAWVRPWVRPFGLLGLFFVDITLVFSLFPKFDLTKIRVPAS